MLRTTILASLLLSALATGCIIETNSDITSSSTLTVTNDSSHDFKELHLTLSTSNGWGADLTDGTLRPGESMFLDGISCETYDVLMIDTTDRQCEIDGISLCFSDADWVITNDTCTAFARVTDATPIVEQVHVGSKSMK